jgi:hypothetical protein
MASDPIAAALPQAAYALSSQRRNPLLAFLSENSLALFLTGCLASVLVSEVLDLFFYPPWTIGDWLINYSQGFIRRGFVGQIILSLSHLVHLPPPVTTVIVQMILYATFLRCVYLLANPLRRDILWYALLFSPATMAFMAMNMSSGCRKELLLHTALAAMMLLILRKPNPILLSLTLTPLLAVLVLSHEIMGSCFLYFFAAVAIATRSLWLSAKILALPYTVAALAENIVRQHIGTLPVSIGICKSIGGRWVGAFNGGYSLCGGAIGHLSWSTSVYHHEELLFLYYWPLYVFYGVLSILPMIVALVVLFRREGKRFEVKVIAWTAVLSTLATAPLFYFAIDWGRWIYMQTECLMLVILFAAQTAPGFLKTSTAPPTGAGEPWRKPLLAATFAYCTLWLLPVTGLSSQRFGYLSIPPALLSQAHHVLHQQKWTDIDRGF